MEEPIKKKKLKGIYIFGWLIILSSIFWLIIHLIPQYVKNIHFLLKLYCFFISTISIFVGWFLVKGKNWARNAIIIISVVVGIATVVIVPNQHKKMDSFFVKLENLKNDEDYLNSLWQSFKEGRLKELKKDGMGTDFDEEKFSDRAKKAMGKGAKTIHFIRLYIYGVFSVGFNVLVIFYFTRPKVKEQFT